MSESIESITDVVVKEHSAELQLLDEARQAIEKATTVRDAKEIADRAQALEVYVKRGKYGDILQDHARQIKLRAERKGGELLAEMKAAGGIAEGRPKKNGPPSGPFPESTNLADLGLSKNQSATWQKIASIPEDEFEAAVVEAKSERDLLRMAKAREQAEEREVNEKKVKETADFSELLELGGIFSTIVIDPPWDRADEGDKNQFGRTQPTYATMPFEAIRNLEVGRLAAENAHLYLWITNRSLPKGFELMKAWDFRMVTMLTWVKPSIGVGNYFRNNTEHVLFGVRGSLPLLRRDVPTAFEAPRVEGLHSGKPDIAYEIFETCSPGPHLDMFSRTHRKGWATFGENGLRRAVEDQDE